MTMTDSDTSPETPTETAARLIREARRIAPALPFEERAKLLRGVTHSVRDAVKHDASIGGAPKGRQWEMDELDKIHQVTETYFGLASDEKR
jgi:hypothetical protein